MFCTCAYESFKSYIDASGCAASMLRVLFIRHHENIHTVCVCVCMWLCGWLGQAHIMCMLKVTVSRGCTGCRGAAGEVLMDPPLPFMMM